MRNKLVDVILSIAFWAGIFAAAGLAGTIENSYTENGFIKAVHMDNTVDVEDFTGNIWQFEGEDYRVQDSVEIIFFNNFTETDRTDDVILDVKII